MQPGSASPRSDQPQTPPYPGPTPGWHPQPPLPPRKGHTALIIGLVVVVVVAVSLILAAVFYAMVSGLINTPPPGSTKPVVVLVVASNTLVGADILIAGVQPAVAPMNYRVNLQVGGVTGTAQSAPASSGASAVIVVGGLPYTVLWRNPGGSGSVSQGDRFVVSYPSGVDAPASGTSITFYLIWQSDGSVVSQASFVVPTPSKPTITMTVSRVTGGVSILVAGIQPPTTPAYFKVNIENVTGAAFGTAVRMPQQSGTNVTVAVSGVTFTITWNNIGGSGFITQGDTFVVTYAGGVGTQWAFLLIWADGSVLPTNANWIG